VYYLFGGDVVDIKYSFSKIDKWSVNITFIKVGSRERWTYIDEGYVNEPISPKFIAPETGFYVAIMKFNFTSRTGMVKLSYKIEEANINAKINYFKPILVLLGSIGLVLCLISYAVNFNGLKIINNEVVYQVISEVKGLWKPWLTVLALLIILLIRKPFLAASFSIPLIAISFKLPLPLSLPYDDPLGVTLDRVITYTRTYNDLILTWYFYLTYMAILTVLIFSHEDENKITRDKLIMLFSKSRVYFAKIISLVILGFIPFALCDFILMTIADVSLIASAPLKLFRIIAIRMGIVFLIFLMALTFTLPVSVLVNKPFLSFIIIIIMPHALQILFPCIAEYMPQKFITTYDLNIALPYIILAPILVVLCYCVFRFRDYA